MNTQDLATETALCEQQREEFEKDHLWEWVVIHEDKIIGFYKEFQEAAQMAVAKFGRGPFLIKEVGRSAPPLPSSLLYRPLYADR